MNIRCLFGHDWEYYIEDREYTIEYSNLVDQQVLIKQHSKTVIEEQECRVCNRCHKKMTKEKTIKSSSVWVESEPSVSDIRNGKLKDLGI